MRKNNRNDLKTVLPTLLSIDFFQNITACGKGGSGSGGGTIAVATSRAEQVVTTLIVANQLEVVAL